MTTETTDSAMYVPHPTRRVVLRPFRVFNAEGVPYRNRRRFATAVDAAAWMAESGVSGFIQNQVSGVSLLPEEVARHQSVGAPGVSVMANDVGYVDALVRTLWLWADKHHREELDGRHPREKGPPVLATGAASRNVLVPSQRSKADGIRAAIREGQRHRWFRSLKSSQALTQSVFGAIQAFDCLGLLQDVPAECGRPAFYEDADGWTLDLEHSLRGLGEPRPTSVDVLASGPGVRVAVECKLTEGEFGTCSRPRLRRGDETWPEQYCNGSYTVQHRRRSRCALTEIGIRYWDHLPRLFDWPDDRDHEPCPFGETYQLARNALAATLTPDGQLGPGQGHVLVVYDARNPSFRGEAKAEQQWKAVVASCRVPGLVRRVSWQRLMAAIADTQELAYLVDGVAEKYGLEPDRSWSQAGGPVTR